MTNDELREKKLSSTEIYNGKILDIFVDEVLLPNGKKSKREIIRKCHASCVLAFNDKGEVILEDQYRYPYDTVLTEIPAGKGEEGEEAIVTAARELEEETGYKAQTIEFLGSFYPTVAYSDEDISIFIAKDLVKTKQHLDDGEALNYYFVPFEEMCNMVRDGRIKDGKTVAAVAQYILKYKTVK